ncbi:histidine--tRNA ligase [Candidatus Micrarchaeota archaeon RBG_16_36_9]|nr:MAG: histidine--tRNA ligase [Candidatus Micrarchaeota archaeon RBG_16_36_9]
MNVKGTRDFMPEEMILRQQVLDKIKSVFEIFGFQPLETPALETWEVLAKKGAGGEDILGETYNFKDKGDRRIGLRYDLTVPLSRVIASNPNLNLPFKRYQIQNVWRYGDIAKDRLREFLQADIDIVGSDSMLADAEIIACAITTLNKLGFKEFKVRLNNRKILTSKVKQEKIPEKEYLATFRVIDKKDKIGEEGVKKELSTIISQQATATILEFIRDKGDSALEELGKQLEDKEGVEELKQIISYLKQMNLNSKIEFDPSLARGLDYYTGPIFEIVAEEGIGSIAGGGRYDKMIGVLSGKDIPATGISLGIERVIEVVKEKKMIETKKSKVKVFVIAVNDNVRDKVLKIVQALRNKSIPADYDLKLRSLSKQLNYANLMEIPNVIIVGEKELKEKSVKLRKMDTGKEVLVKLDDLVTLLSTEIYKNA